MSTARKLAAIFYADVAGYSRLTGIDEEGTHRRVMAILDGVADQIQGSDGAVLRSAGDAVLATFSSVVRAVQTAVDIQRRLARENAQFPDDRRVDIRIGINLGDVIEDRGEVYGSGVNIAARLEATAEPGGISLSGTAFEHTVDRVPEVFSDCGEQSFKNIERPVRVWRWSPGDSPAATAASSPKQAAPSKPSIAVLPFDNMSADPEQVFFAEGMAEDIITELSKFHSLFVIARNSSFSFKGQSLDVREVGASLGVRYVVEGSVRRSGKRIRVTAQLIDASEDRHLWAERFDRDVEDVFALQDELTLAIVTAIEPQLVQSERQRALRQPPENLDAWESYQRGLWHMFQYRASERETALRFLTRATELDPNFASAYAGLSYGLYVYVILGAYDDREEDLRRAFDYAEKAVRLDESDPFGWVALRRGYMLRGEHESAIAAADKAISRNPNLALAHFGRAHALWHAGRPADAIVSHDETLRLSPYDPLKWAYTASKAIALHLTKRFDEAIEISRSSQREANSAIFSHLAEMAALGYRGEVEKAQIAIDVARVKKPDLSVSYIDEALPISDPQCRSFFLEGFRKAGLPES